MPARVLNQHRKIWLIHWAANLRAGVAAGQLPADSLTNVWGRRVETGAVRRAAARRPDADGRGGRSGGGRSGGGGGLWWRTAAARPAWLGAAAVSTCQSTQQSSGAGRSGVERGGEHVRPPSRHCSVRARPCWPIWPGRHSRCLWNSNMDCQGTGINCRDSCPENQRPDALKFRPALSELRECSPTGNLPEGGSLRGRAEFT